MAKSKDDSVKQPPIRQKENPDSGLINDFNHEGTEPEMDRGIVHVIKGNTPGMRGKAPKTSGTY